MVKETGEKEDKGKEIRENLICEKCSSKFVYALANQVLVCRKCGHRTQPND